MKHIMARMTFRITRGGQVTVPAAVRRRWRTSTVLAEDRGDHLILRPAPDDPVAAASGAFTAEVRAGPRLDEMRRLEREEEAELARRERRD